MPTARDDRERQTHRRIAELAEEWRRTAAALPFWQIDDSGSELVLIGNDLGKPVATLHGDWAPNLARFLAAMNKTAGVSLAELLWTVSSGTAGSRVTQQAVHLLQAMGLEESTDRYRPR